MPTPTNTSTPAIYELEIPPTLADKLADLGYPDPLDGLHAAAKLLVGLGPAAWATITRAAELQKTTPAKIVLARLDSNITSRATRNSVRDREIWDMAKKGATHAVIAARFNLSLIRVSQIVSTQRAKAAEAQAAEAEYAVDM